MTELIDPMISIITVSYNSENTIKDTLNSVNEQSWDNLEHIIIDGGSTDDTLAVIEKYGKRVTRIISEKDKGIYNAMNKGIELTSGNIIGFNSC